MGQFMRQQVLPGIGLRRIAVGAEDYIWADGVGERPDRLRRFRRPGIGMDPDLAEVLSEAWFEEGTGRAVERLARRTEYLVYQRWRFGGVLVLQPVRCLPTGLLPILCGGGGAGAALALEPTIGDQSFMMAVGFFYLAAAALALEGRWRARLGQWRQERQPHYLIGNSVRLLFIAVVCGANRQLGLERWPLLRWLHAGCTGAAAGARPLQPRFTG